MAHLVTTLNVSLYGTTAEIHIFAQLGGIVSIGTDWTYSGSANMLELACADEWNRDYLDAIRQTTLDWRPSTQPFLQYPRPDRVSEVVNRRCCHFQPMRVRLSAVLEADNVDVGLVLKSVVPLGRARYGQRLGDL